MNILLPAWTYRLMKPLPASQPNSIPLPELTRTDDGAVASNLKPTLMVSGGLAPTRIVKEVHMKTTAINTVTALPAM